MNGTRRAGLLATLLLFVATPVARAADPLPLPIFDAHLHYNCLGHCQPGGSANIGTGELLNDVPEGGTVVAQMKCIFWASDSDIFFTVKMTVNLGSSAVS
jgi:hypothetical protein